jgi:hypothetical protein
MSASLPEQTTADHFDFAPIEVSDPTVSWRREDVCRPEGCSAFISLSSLDPWVEFPGSAIQGVCLFACFPE